jgi:hypothetical protein
MSFDDFCKYFTNIDIVHIFNDKNCQKKNKKWNCLIRKGVWDSNTSGGLFSNSKHWKTRFL